MPTFDFSFIKKENKKKKTINNINKYKVIEQDVQGVIRIDINANYYVSVNNTKYGIKQECYSCKGKARIYRLGVDDYRRQLYIRHAGDYPERNSLFFIPFTFGMIVKGSLVLNKYLNIIVFNITKCHVDYDNEECRDAVNFYINNYKRINEIIRKRQCNGI